MPAPAAGSPVGAHHLAPMQLQHRPASTPYLHTSVLVRQGLAYPARQARGDKVAQALSRARGHLTASSAVLHAQIFGKAPLLGGRARQGLAPPLQAVMSLAGALTRGLCGAAKPRSKVTRCL